MRTHSHDEVQREEKMQQIEIHTLTIAHILRARTLRPRALQARPRARLVPLLIMAKIQEEVKLDFKDVLIRPKRSTLKSRSQVSLERTIRMKHSGKELHCVPIIAAK
jgi:hypothetical protein